jgi:hypothetical protein
MSILPIPWPMTEIQWSKLLESMRKDVKCTFGILKERWRILKSGMEWIQLTQFG